MKPYRGPPRANTVMRNGYCSPTQLEYQRIADAIKEKYGMLYYMQADRMGTTDKHFRMLRNQRWWVPFPYLFTQIARCTPTGIQIPKEQWRIVLEDAGLL